MNTLIGACGNAGCLDCTPAFMEVIDDPDIDDGYYEIDISFSRSKK